MDGEYKLAVIVYCDISREIFDKIFSKSPGTLLQQIGQEAMLEFSNVNGAILFSLDLITANELTKEPCNIGLHIGQVKLDEEQLGASHGVVLDIAGKIAHISRESGIYISGAIQEIIVTEKYSRGISLRCKYIKDIEKEQIRVYQLVPEE